MADPQITNSFIADQFLLLSRLLEIHGANSFKSRTYSSAAFNIDKLETELADTDPSELPGIRGIGDSTAKKVTEIIQTGKLQALQDLIQETPAGVLEMLNIKGIGPKKIAVIWKDMQIESVGELLYACNENRLSTFKGFGAKTQENIQEAVEYYSQNQGSFLYAQVEALIPGIRSYLEKSFGADAVAVTGAYRRQAHTIDELEFVILKSNDQVKPVFQTAQPPELLEETSTTLVYKLKNGLRLRLHTGAGSMAERLFHTTGPDSFTSAFAEKHGADLTELANHVDEPAFFKKSGVDFIEPYLRDHPRILSLAGERYADLITESDIKGIIHTHSKWSDGANTIHEMAKACINKGYEYLVISDHSKTAFYANGLSEERITQQHKEIDKLNAALKPFRIFKSIECDILNDGALDYSDEVLASFDLVIASVHANLKMTEEKAMQRLLNAISNPFTTILGHLTGRLLLSRKGYPVNHSVVIDACAKNHVALELNAHPRRLDIDWTWIPEVIDKNVMISIDPDAHHTDGFNDCRYGVLAAQKGGLKKEHNLSSMSLQQFEDYLTKRKETKGLR